MEELSIPLFDVLECFIPPSGNVSSLAWNFTSADLESSELYKIKKCRIHGHPGCTGAITLFVYCC